MLSTLIMDMIEKGHGSGSLNKMCLADTSLGHSHKLLLVINYLFFTFIVLFRIDIDTFINYFDFT